MRIKRTFPYLLSAVLIILILLYPVQALQGAKTGFLPSRNPCSQRSSLSLLPPVYSPSLGPLLCYPSVCSL